MKRVIAAIKNVALVTFLSATFVISCLAQPIKLIPVHFHLQQKVDYSRLDEQINFLNREFYEQSLPFRFHIASVDDKPIKIGGADHLNVFVEDLQPVMLYGVAAFPWEYDEAPDKDLIRIDINDSLPAPGNGSGIVLQHEIGHWLGLYHIWTMPIPGKEPNCMDTFEIEPIGQCVFNEEQKQRMIVIYDVFRDVDGPMADRRD